LSLPKIKWPSFKSDEAPAPIIENNIGETKLKASDVKLTEIKPRLKPRLKPITRTSTGLRGPFQFSADAPQNLSGFEKFQRGTQVKWSATKRWVKAKVTGVKNMRTLDGLAHATDKASIMNKLPGKGLVQIGDRTVSVYGLILILAFALVLLLMSLAKPSSRLGGRH